MSELEDKLVRHHSLDGKARRPLRSLAAAGGYSVLARDGEGPTLVEITPMDHSTRWRRVGGRGADSTFELIEESTH
jgi:hypothetical protein